MTEIAVQFGAGNIGRGFIGALLSQAGYEVVFVDVVESLVEAINRRRQYSIKEIAGDQEKIVTIENVRAINGKAETEVAAAISQASLITTAVGPGILRIIASTIAQGLQQRAGRRLASSLNVIACENLIDNSKILQDYVLEKLPADYQVYVKSHVGFPRCVVDKVVTSPSESELERDALSVVTEEYGLLIVDQQGFVGKPPAIDGMQLTDNLDAYVEQKIFTLNTAHAVTAYLGYLKGHEFIHEALQDPEIRPVILGTIGECSAVLVKRHNLDPAAQERYVDSVLKRFENSSMPDPVVRVAREPQRKLAPNDRLIKPARLALASGVTPAYLATGIAAALLYDWPDDPQAIALRKAIEERGLEAVLAEVCDLSPDDPLAKLIEKKLEEVK